LRDGGTNNTPLPLACSACNVDGLISYARATDGELFRCKNCGSKVLRPWPTVAGAAPSVYGNAYRQGQDTAKASASFALFRRFLQPPATPCAQLLDVGCGDGSFLVLAREAGWDVTGLDTDEGAIAALGTLGIPGITARLGNTIPLEKMYDVITLWDVIEHVVEIREAVQWLAQAVRPGGKIFVLTPDADSAFDRLAAIEQGLSRRSSHRLLDLCLNRHHRHRFTRRGLCSLFRRFGFGEDVVGKEQLFSLRRDLYLDGFVPGIPSWTRSRAVNRSLSRCGWWLIRLCGLKNKILYVGTRIENGSHGA
jgi:SAM-dependent methyltransferase